MFWPESQHWLQIKTLPGVGAVVVVGGMSVTLTKTDFVHLRRWLPLMIVMAATVVGELASGLWLVHSALGRADLGEALALLPDFYRLQSWDTSWWRVVVGVLVGVAIWTTATDDVRSRKRLWRDD